MYSSFPLSISKFLDAIEFAGKALFFRYKKTPLKNCIIKLSQDSRRAYYPLSKKITTCWQNTGWIIAKNYAGYGQLTQQHLSTNEENVPPADLSPVWGREKAAEHRKKKKKEEARGGPDRSHRWKCHNSVTASDSRNARCYQKDRIKWKSKCTKILIPSRREAISRIEDSHQISLNFKAAQQNCMWTVGEI